MFYFSYKRKMKKAIYKLTDEELVELFKKEPNRNSLHREVDKRVATEQYEGIDAKDLAKFIGYSSKFVNKISWADIIWLGKYIARIWWFDKENICIGLSPAINQKNSLWDLRIEKK